VSRHKAKKSSNKRGVCCRNHYTPTTRRRRWRRKMWQVAKWTGTNGTWRLSWSCVFGLAVRAGPAS